MDQEQLNEFREDFAILVEAGFVAVKQLDEPSATHLFRAAELLHPESPAPHVGLGYIHMNKLETAKAIAIFEKVLKDEPEHHLTQALLGICYALKKNTRKKGEDMLKKAMEATDDPTIRYLGEVSLKWIDKDLKNNKAPFFTGAEAQSDAKVKD